MIVVLPKTNGAIEIDGASFDVNNAIIIFEHEAEEEALTILHEIGHVLDPGWQTYDMAAAYKGDCAKAPAGAVRLLNRVGANSFERFAELVAWEIAGVRQIASFPRSRKVMLQALNWEDQCQPPLTAQP